MSSYDKAHCRREQAGMAIQAECNVRDRKKLSVWDALPYNEVSKEYGRLLKNKIDKDKCRKSSRHI
jgi:hypothetical protein